MYLARLDPNDLQFERKPYDELMAYAQSKRALMMLTELWAFSSPVKNSVRTTSASPTL